LGAGVAGTRRDLRVQWNYSAAVVGGITEPAGAVVRFILSK